ncbi:MAG: LacI family transcriptional regulator, partial [Clostridia bacterium]|nr:LacI family transcriptional regulator [Clostridia bacterium]
HLKDVAKAAGVSQATVTRVVNGSGYVSEEKRRAVQNAILALGYVRDISKPPKLWNDMKLIGLLSLGVEDNLLFARLADSLHHAAQAHGYLIVTVNVSGDPDAAHIAGRVNEMRNLNVCGIIFNSLGDTVDFMSIRRFLINQPIPLVMIERVPDIYGLNKVLVNSKEGLFLAVRHLVRQGHRRILYMAADLRADVENSRLEGFRAATSAMGCEDEAAYLPCRANKDHIGRQAFSDYVAVRGMPTAVIASEVLLVGVLQYLYERGIRIPNDISLIGLNDALARYTTPALTSLAFPEKEIAENAMSIIHHAQSEVFLPKTIMLSPRLVERDSVAAPVA